MNVLAPISPKDAPSDREPSQAPPEGDDGHEAAAHGAKGGNERPTEPQFEPGAAATASEPAPPAPSRKAVNQRRYRRHQATGIKTVPVPVDYNVIDRLVDEGRLESWNEDDREKIGEALAAWFRDEPRCR